MEMALYKRPKVAKKQGPDFESAKAQCPLARENYRARRD